MRIKMLIAYNGSSFEGSQVQQRTSNTVMGALYAAFESLNIHTKIHMSGRTDTAVHAAKQVLHCDLPTYWSDTKKLERYMHNALPTSIRIRHIEIVDDTFHARYSAKRRAYRYVLSNRPVNPFESDFITFVDEPLDIKRLQQSLSVFEGEHDFSSFKKSGSSNKTNIRTIYKTRCYTYRGKTILYFEANGFLRSQIRLMVAFILKINANELTLDQLKEQLNNNALYLKRPASPNGLYLSNIIY